MEKFSTIVAPWALVFVLINLFVTQDGGPNATSRFLTMRSMAEEGTFTIDKRIGASIDWAQTSDGHYYSNKAPGPMLLGFPVFFVIDQIPRIWEKGYRDENGYRSYPGYFQKTFMSFLMQIFPFIFLVALGAEFLANAGKSYSAQLFFILASFFGSTAVLYMNNYSGHAFAAVLVLAILLALLKEKFWWAGFFSGAAMLSDYGFGMQLPALFLCLFFLLRKKQKPIYLVRTFLSGAIIPASLWIWYHTVCFGGPFTIANHFQNPIFLDTAKESMNLWGLFRLPNQEAFVGLLFGNKRGILFTQPWILLGLLIGFVGFFSRKKAAGKIIGCFCFLSFVGLLFMNCSFGAWYGGSGSGPRYLCMIFPSIALWVAWNFDDYFKIIKMGFWVTLSVSIFFRILVYTSTILGEYEAIWEFYFMRASEHLGTSLLRAGIFLLLLAAAGIWQRKKLKEEHIFGY